MKYRLPEELCGADYEGYVHGGVLTVEVPGIGRVMIPASAVTEVKDPLPPEPARGVVVSVGVFVYQRLDDDWYQPGEDFGASWAQVCSNGTPVRLVPEQP